MNFPKNNRELNEIFKKAAMSKISDFQGEYFVDMLTGLPSLKKISHRKVFYPRNNEILGHNLIFSNKIWGCFFVEEGICKELNGLRVAIINYDRKKNSFISNRIRDYVRCIEHPALFLGRFNYIFWGKPRFLGYFSLLKTK